VQCVHHKSYFVILFLVLLLTVQVLFAKSGTISTSITIDAIEGNGLDLRDLELSIDALFKNNSTYRLAIGSIILPDNKGQIKNIALQCDDGILSKQLVACDDGKISFDDPLASAKQAKIKFRRTRQGGATLSIQNFNLADGSATLQAELNKGAWQARLKSNQISFDKLKQLLPDFPAFLSQGEITSDLILVGSESSVRKITGDAKINNFAFTNEESTVVGEEVALNVSFSSNRRDNEWQCNFNATAFQGELYFDPVFIDANQSPKDMYGMIRLDTHTKQIKLEPVSYEDSRALHVSVNTLYDYENNLMLEPVQATIEYALFPNVYDDYMQPFFLDTNIADLASTGRISGEVKLDGKRIVETNLQLDYLTLSDKQNRFSIADLNGNFGWGSRYAGKNYEFSFTSAGIYKIELGGSAFSFSNKSDELILNQSVSVPLLDGAFNIESFKVNQPGEQEQSILMDVSLTPVSMSKLSTALGWPEMNGNLAGYAPNISYKQGDIDMQGALLIRGFGGSTTIHNLSASDLFSITPKLSADVQLNNLDLRSLTETFSFGEITGRLSGSINNLHFVSWVPVEFDAWFGTPEDDKSKHRISQTAVDNLTQVGNGGGNILSKSFLRFFDSFGYDKLGLGCRLKNNTCSMRGVFMAGTNCTTEEGGKNR